MACFYLYLMILFHQNFMYLDGNKQHRIQAVLKSLFKHISPQPWFLPVTPSYSFPDFGSCEIRGFSASHNTRGRWARPLPGMAGTVFPRKDVVGKSLLYCAVVGESRGSSGSTQWGRLLGVRTCIPVKCRWRRACVYIRMHIDTYVYHPCTYILTVLTSPYILLVPSNTSFNPKNPITAYSSREREGP